MQEFKIPNNSEFVKIEKRQVSPMPHASSCSVKDSETAVMAPNKRKAVQGKTQACILEYIGKVELSIASICRSSTSWLHARYVISKVRKILTYHMFSYHYHCFFYLKSASKNVKKTFRTIIRLGENSLISDRKINGSDKMSADTNIHEQ